VLFFDENHDHHNNLLEVVREHREDRADNRKVIEVDPEEERDNGLDKEEKGDDLS